jgi:hypothetical protein
VPEISRPSLGKAFAASAMIERRPVRRFAPTAPCTIYNCAHKVCVHAEFYTKNIHFTTFLKENYQIKFFKTLKYC